jgi:hypothetical protein
MIEMGGAGDNFETRNSGHPEPMVSPVKAV